MVYPREILNKIKWTKNRNLKGAKIWYVHRGAPGDTMRIPGESIVSLGQGFFETQETRIPYHRITRIDFEEKTVFRREKK